MKFLILRFSSIGDIVLTSPVIRCLKKKFPNSEIHYATKKSFKPVVLHNPYLTKIHLLDNSLINLIHRLKQEKFDCIIDLHNNQRTLLIKNLLRTKSFSYGKLNFEKWLLVNFKINRLPQKHIVDRYLETVITFGVENDDKGLDYFISADEEVDLKSLPSEFSTGYIGWVIGGQQDTKKFPAEKIIRVIKQLNYPVICLGGKEDFDTGERIKLGIRSQKHSPFLNACGAYSINQSASLVKQARVVATNDTGLMHIAAAFKKPIVSIWGNTIPEFGMSPHFGKDDVKSTILEIKNLHCRPCSKLGFNQCPENHFLCMNMLEELKVREAIESQL